VPLLIIAVAVLLLISAAAGANQGFKDVPDGSTHQPGIDWVADMGITQGCGDGTKYFPDQPVTRGQMATFLHRMSKAIPTVEIHTAGMMVGPEKDISRVETLAKYGELSIVGYCTQSWAGDRFIGNTAHVETEGATWTGITDFFQVGDRYYQVEVGAVHDQHGYDCWFTWIVTEVKVEVDE
jgi:hypothetical protein